MRRLALMGFKPDIAGVLGMEPTRAPLAEDLAVHRLPIEKHGDIVVREDISGGAVEHGHEAVPRRGRELINGLKTVSQRIREANMVVRGDPEGELVITG